MSKGRRNKAKLWICGYALTLAVTVPRDLWVSLEVSGGDDQVWWMITEQAEVGFTGDRFALSGPPATCSGQYYFADHDPYAGFYLRIEAETAADPNPCIVNDNGAGTIDLPPQGCEYVSPYEVHEIINGLPPVTTIELDASHKDFINVTTSPGGTLGGEIEEFESTLELDVSGTGSLAGFNRHLAVPVECEVHTGPRNPGDPVQSFAADMFRLQGELFGDPDFCTFRITGGTDNGLPSPGHTTLTDLGNGLYHVDSFFDIAYEIDFEGCPGSQLDGFMGVTTGTLRMRTGTYLPSCAGACPVGFICDPSATGNADGSIDYCCNCREAFGACCLDDFTCVVTTESDCVDNLGGVFEGDGTTCGGDEACCLPDDTCVMADALCCVLELNGSPQGPGSICRPLEACCFGDGSCRDLDPQCCVEAGGTPHGPGSQCLGTEACCLPDNTCQDMDAECCIVLGGIPQGPGSVCQPLEACCFADDSCQDLDPQCCLNAGGIPGGLGTQCLGVEPCCRPDATCDDIDAFCCAADGGLPRGPGSACVDVCCIADRPTAAEDWKATTLEMTGSPTCTTNADCPQTSQCIDNICYFIYNRYLYFNPNNDGKLVALRVRHIATGATRWVDWVDPVLQVVHNNNDPAMLTYAFTHPSVSPPEYAYWPQEVIGITGCFIVPGELYEIQAIATDCDPTDEGDFSPPVRLPTAIFGDAISTLTPPGPNAFAYPPQGPLVDVMDMTAIVEGFKNTNWTSKLYCDLVGLADDPSFNNVVVDVSDMTAVVDAFGGGAYPGMAPSSCP